MRAFGRSEAGPWALRVALFALIATGAAGGAAGATTPTPERIAADRAAVRTFRSGLAQVTDFAAARPDLFPTNRLAELRLLTREQKEEIRDAWRAFLDYSVALDSIRRFHAPFLLIKDKSVRDQSFLAAYEAFLAQYRFSLEFIRRVENDRSLDPVLNDPVPELGLESGQYTRLTALFLNAGRAAEFAAFRSAWALTPHKPEAAVFAEEDVAAILQLGRGEGERLTLENALELLRKGGAVAWFPIQKGASIWMGDTKVWRKGGCLIAQKQIEELASSLEPGDVLLERREWYLSNVGLPGFWPHAALFVGTPEVRRAFFDDPEVKAWVAAQGQADGDFEALLSARYPEAYAESGKPVEDGHRPRVLEAIGEGVLFTTLEHSAAADSLAVLRPRLSRKERAVALWRAFPYVGRPYDYNFDFATDSALVCTELVCKSYEACADSRGLQLPVLNILGRLATPANEIVRQFDATFGKPDQQYDLVLFLDGNEKARKAVPRDLDAFRQSWRRPKWHVITPAAARET